MLTLLDRYDCSLQQCHWPQAIHRCHIHQRTIIPASTPVPYPTSNTVPLPPMSNSHLQHICINSAAACRPWLRVLPAISRASPVDFRSRLKQLRHDSVTLERLRLSRRLPSLSHYRLMQNRAQSIMAQTEARSVIQEDVTHTQARDPLSRTAT